MSLPTVIVFPEILGAARVVNDHELSVIPAKSTPFTLPERSPSSIFTEYAFPFSRLLCNLITTTFPFTEIN